MLPSIIPFLVYSNFLKQVSIHMVLTIAFPFSRDKELIYITGVSGVDYKLHRNQRMLFLPVSMS